MSIWGTIADPRDSTGNTKIKLYSKLGQQILVKYEKHMNKCSKNYGAWPGLSLEWRPLETATKSLGVLACPDN